jgi:hypothetical protein
MSPFGLPRILPILVVTGLVAPLSRAADGDFPTVKFSGFASIVGGQIVNNPTPGLSPDPSLTPPIYIADWSNWGTYNKSFSFKPESRAGAQAVIGFTEDLKFTGQVVIRGVDTTPNITWAFLSYNITSDWEVQVGRKRIPLYYYSDFQDIGYSYPWVSPPPEVYGWEATNFNGASLRHKGTVGDTTYTVSLFGGQEHINKDRYMLSSGQPETDVAWKDIRGGDLEISKGWLTLRGVYLQANPEFTDRLDASLNHIQKMKAFGLAANADFNDLFFLTEYGQNTRTTPNNLEYKAPCYTVGVGYRVGKWTPFLNFAKYWENTTDSSYAPVNYKRGAFTLRYDLTSNSAIKVQLDRYLEFNGTTFTTDSTIVRVAFDVVF